MSKAPALLTTCKACRSEAKVKLEYLIASGESLRSVSERFKIPYYSLRRHWLNHVPEERKKAAKIGPFESEERLRSLVAESGTSVLENLRSVYNGLAAMWLKAFDADALGAVVSLSAQMHANLGLQAKLTKELAPAQHNHLTVNAFLTPGWLESLGRDLLELTRDYPEIKSDLTALLRRRMDGGSQGQALLNVSPERRDAAA